MSGRYAQLDSDESRLPDGMQRIGYDSDTQVYTFRDRDGSLWESAPGSQYGSLYPAGTRRPAMTVQEESNFLQNKRESWRYMAPFLLLVMLVLALAWRFLGPSWSSEGIVCPEGSAVYSVVRDDTCWAIAKRAGVSLERLREVNVELDCDHLNIGQPICVPATKI